ncbi:hypothetical protein BE08_14555 [Sorangium cellulosum]|uniref:Transposase (putative) YhgA-like domain-containing protein n=1 Tax=Sorangium cellulosum TaxID=56 RepID=A0A150PTY7_SORCE|nr:hypothetical protein BE08_14555 [Sorangium cellulosum]
MPTLEHNGLVDMFRENPSLAPHLLKLLFHLDLPPYATVAVVESSLDQLIPIEFRADLVLELRDERGGVVLSIVLELQRDIDRRKSYSWPVYVAVVRAQKECDTVVVVVAPDAEVAAWAAQKIDLGLGLGTLQPLVIGPAIVPEVTDQAEAEKETELAILSAVAHGNGPNGLAVIQAALGALVRFDREHAAVYFQIVYNALRDPMRRALEALIMERQTEGKATFPPFAQQLIERGKLEGIREGKLEGIREGKLEGIREGELKGKRDALLRLIARAGFALTAGDHARIQACTDPATLDRWVDNVLGAKSAADVFS